MSQSGGAQFTPGPWIVDEVSEDEAGQETLGICAEEGGYVAGIHCGPDTTIDEQDRANATLIAAAPVMYAALREAEKHLTDLANYGSEGIPEPLLVSVRSAIAQAEGRQA